MHRYWPFAVISLRFGRGQADGALVVAADGSEPQSQVAADARQGLGQVAEAARKTLGVDGP
jgi:hypothetical protein